MLSCRTVMLVPELFCRGFDMHTQYSVCRDPFRRSHNVVVRTKRSSVQSVSMIFSAEVGVKMRFASDGSKGTVPFPNDQYECKTPGIPAMGREASPCFGAGVGHGHLCLPL
jgi:hypothetical protein